MPSTKKTVLDGYYASGDCECFCFDKRTFEQAMQETSEACDRLATCGDRECAWADPDEGNRVYPDALLPDHGRRRGRWTIVVTFEPESELP